MELDVFKILLRHAQHVARIGKKDIAPLNILGHVLAVSYTHLTLPTILLV